MMQELRTNKIIINKNAVATKFQNGVILGQRFAARNVCIYIANETMKIWVVWNKLS